MLCVPQLISVVLAVAVWLEVAVATPVLVHDRSEATAVSVAATVADT